MILKEFRSQVYHYYNRYDGMDYLLHFLSRVAMVDLTIKFFSDGNENCMVLYTYSNKRHNYVCIEQVKTIFANSIAVEPGGVICDIHDTRDCREQISFIPPCFYSVIHCESY